MVEEIATVISIWLLTMLKFIFGPTLGYAAGFPIWLTLLVTVGGMMSSVVLFSYFGTIIRERVFKKYFPRKRLFTKGNRRTVRLWKKYGVTGTAILTPILLTPIGGTIVMVAAGTPKKLIFTTMFLSAVFWGAFFTAGLYLLGKAVLPGNWIP